MKTRFLLCILAAGLASLRAADAPDPIAPVLRSTVDKQLAAGVVALVADKDKVLALDAAGYESLKTKDPIAKRACSGSPR